MKDPQKNPSAIVINLIFPAHLQLIFYVFICNGNKDMFLGYSWLVDIYKVLFNT